MSLDSTANLLFTIGADSSDAEGNIKKFRGILSKDLDGMKAEFADWSKKVFGDMSTAGGLFAGVAAGVAAAGVAIGAALVGAADKAAKYALEIDEASDRTGIGAEDMSRLRYAAESTGTSYSSLLTGLTAFSTAIDAARDPTSKQADLFHRLGISQKEIENGSRDALPLLLRVSDAFRNDMTQVERASVSRQLFSRGGADLIDMLQRGSGALKGFGAEAERLGLVIGEDSVEAAKRYRAEIAYLKAGLEGIAVVIGTTVLPVLNNLFVGGEAVFGGLKAMIAGGFGPAAGANFAAGLVAGGQEAMLRLDAAAKASMASRMGLEAPGGNNTAQTKQDFEGLGSILDQVRGQMAGLAGEEAKIAFESNRMQDEVVKATMKLSTLAIEGKITGTTFAREAADLAQLPAAIAALATAQIAELEKKRAEAAVKATEELQSKLSGLEEQTYANRAAAVTREIADLRQKLTTEKTLTEDNQRLLVAIEKAGLQQIEKERAAAFIKELVELQAQLASILTSQMTHAMRLRFQYDQEQERFSAAEEEKVVAVAKGEAEQDAIRQQFALNRKASLVAYLGDLNALHNSTGWRGVFGAEFADAIRGNEELLQEWATSANQSLLMVRVAGEAVTESLQRGFGNFSKAMGANIAQAIVYKTSIGEAMRAAAASALESIAAESIVQAIYATALGFLRLAHHDYPGAASAFTAAAIFGSVGAVAAVAGRAIAPKQAGAGASGTDSGSTASGGAADSSSGSGSSGGPRVQVIVNGHIVGASGIEELTDMINEAVQGRDVRLVATQVRQETRAIR
jgi:hypothetical protein